MVIPARSAAMPICATFFNPFCWRTASKWLLTTGGTIPRAPGDLLGVEAGAEQLDYLALAGA